MQGMGFFEGHFGWRVFIGRPLGWAALMIFLVSLISASADARTATVRWTDPNPAPSPVTNFRLYVGTSPGVFAAGIDLGVPVPDSEGASVPK